LKISAITSQRLLDPFQNFLLHRLHPQHAVDHVERELLREDRQYARRVFGPDFREHDRDGLRVFVLQVVGEHLFLDVGELLPHVAAGRTANFFHDVADALGRQVLLQQALGGVVVAGERA
jgi:hypothetical protein